VDWYQGGPVTAGSDGSISIWAPTGSIKFKIRAHDAPVVGIDLHPVGGMMVSAAKDGKWAVHDLVQETTLVKYEDEAGMLSQTPTSRK